MTFIREKRFLLVITALLISAIACRAATRLIIPDTPTPPPSPAPTNVFTPLPVITSTPTPRPIPQPIVCTDDSCLNACLARIKVTLETHEFESLGGEYAGTNANLNLVVYKVENGELGEPDMLYIPEEFKTFQEDLQAHQLVWDYASNLLPPEQLKWITEYVIFTDGMGTGWAAWVNTRDPLDRSRWQLGVDIADAQNPVDLTYTLIHEFGHVLTLNSDQIPQTEYFYNWAQNPGACQQFTSPEGCSKPDSYINLFYQAFWVDIFDEWREKVEKVQTNSNDEFFALLDEFYNNREDQFVNSYATSNIREDLAESFTQFVLDPKPTGDLVFEKKILFFYDFPEMLILRKQIIQNVCSYTQE